MAGLLVAALRPGPPVAAQTAPAAVSVTVMRQRPTVELGGTADLRLRIQGPIGLGDGLEVQVVAHPRVDSFEALIESIATTDIEGFKDSVEFELASLQRYADGDVAVDVDLKEIDGGFDFQKLNIQVAGVYPIEIVVRDAREDDLAQTISWLVVTEPETEPSIRMNAIWVAPSDVLVERDGVSPNADFLTSTAAGGALHGFAERLHTTRLPVALALSPATIDTWARATSLDPDSATSFSRLETGLAEGRFSVLPQPYAEIDGPSVEAGDLGSRVPDSFVDGAQTLQEVIAVRPQPSTVYAPTLDTASAERLGATFAYQLVVEPAAIRPSPPTGTFTLQAGERDFAATVVRHDLATLVAPNSGRGTANASESRRLQQLFAFLALEADVDPDRPHTVVIGNDFDRDLFRRLERSLNDQSLIDFVPLDEAFVEPPPTPIFTLAPAATAAPMITPLEVFEIERQIDAFVAFVGTEHPAVLAAEANLRLVLARDLPVAELRDRLDDLDRAIAGFVGGIGTESKHVTLTDRRSEVPLSFRNDTGREVEVRVRLSSQKLVFPDGPERVITLPPGRNTQAAFLVEARASGTFPLEVAITSVDRSLAVGSPTQITVQSAVFGSAGTWLTVGALVFLALWWAHHIWRSRRVRPAAS